MSHNENGAEPHSDPPRRARVQDSVVGGGISGLAIRRPVFTSMVMIGLMVLGIFSFRRLAIDQFPDVDIPIVAVQTIYPGGSPETVEREGTQRLEEEIGRASCRAAEEWGGAAGGT